MALRGGGYVLYVRHGATDTSRPDQVPIDLDDCDTQRPPSEAGRLEIAQVGEAIREVGIPAWQTRWIAERSQARRA